MKDIKEYIEAVEKLQNDTFVSPHQATIDMLEYVFEELNEWYWYQQGNVTLDTLLGSLSYKVDTLLEVVNPEFVKDRTALEKLLEILKA